jgi:hypothetical protein
MCCSQNEYLESPLAMAQRKSTDIREAILLAKKASSKKSSNRNDTSGGDSSAATHAKTIKKVPTTHSSGAQTTVSADVHNTGTADASASTVRMRNPVPTFREGEERERLKQHQNGELRASRDENTLSAAARRRVVHSSMTASAAAAAAAAGPTMATGGDDDLGPEGAEAGSDDEGEEEIGKGDQHACISTAQFIQDLATVQMRWFNMTASVHSSSRFCCRGALYTLESGVGL